MLKFELICRHRNRMEWKEFLEHPQVANFTYQGEQGEYLFGIVLHDSLHAINNYRASITLAQQENLPKEIRNWISKSDANIDIWLRQLYSIEKQHYKSEHSTHQTVWKELIAKVGTMISEVSIIIADFDALPQITTKHNNFALVDMALDSLRDLQQIHFDIRNKEYLKLWKRVVNI